MEGQDRGEGKDELEDRGDLLMGEYKRGDCLSGEWGIGERKGLPPGACSMGLPPGEEQLWVESVVSSSSLASCQHRGTPNLKDSTIHGSFI